MLLALYILQAILSCFFLAFYVICYSSMTSSCDAVWYSMLKLRHICSYIIGIERLLGLFPCIIGIF